MKRNAIFSGLERQGCPRPGLPLVELAGDRRVLIENHRGISEYSREKISICVCFGQIILTGNALEICHMSNEQLVIRGSIDEIRIATGC